VIKLDLDKILAKGRVPDFLLRRGIRRVIKKRIKKQNQIGIEARFNYLKSFIENLKTQPIAVQTEAANE
jgi:cyclopropane-fatty-acyl-phospholipid synthase